MPKPRLKGKFVKKRIFIVCEGAKTEPNYFHEFLQDFNFRGTPVEIQVVNSGKNTAVQLIEVAQSLKEFAEDDAWAVFDKDGYTMHPLAFELAEQYDIRIAFSSIAFEYWFLLHFEYNTHKFERSKEIIDYLKEHNMINYHKNDRHTYRKIKQFTDRAISNAKKIQKLQKTKHPDTAIYELNPFCNVNEIIEAIRSLEKEWK